MNRLRRPRPKGGTAASIARRPSTQVRIAQQPRVPSPPESLTSTPRSRIDTLRPALAQAVPAVPDSSNLLR